VRGADLIEVTTKDNRRFRARLVGRDRQNDMAILEIPPERLIAVEIGDSRELQVGDFVMAIGNPFGLGQTVTSGNTDRCFHQSWQFRRRAGYA
jgi:S1-C subfamily serine protease